MTLIERSGLATLWRALRVRFHLPDLDPLAELPVLGDSGGKVVVDAGGDGGKSEAKAGRKIKVSAVLDPLDEGEVEPLPLSRPLTF